MGKVSRKGAGPSPLALRGSSVVEEVARWRVELSEKRFVSLWYNAMNLIGFNFDEIIRETTFPSWSGLVVTAGADAMHFSNFSNETYKNPPPEGRGAGRGLIVIVVSWTLEFTFAYWVLVTFDVCQSCQYNEVLDCKIRNKKKVPWIINDNELDQNYYQCFGQCTNNMMILSLLCTALSEIS